MFEKLIPEAYQKQLSRANEKSHLKIPETSFSTITINRNFRTALHKDAGDFSEGFGNLTVIERGSYHGGYTVFPQFGVGVDVRSGDFLAMDVHQWHSNTAIFETEEDKRLIFYDSGHWPLPRNQMIKETLSFIDKFSD